MFRQSPFSPGFRFPFASPTKHIFGAQYLTGSSLPILTIPLHFRLAAQEGNAVNAADNGDG